MQKKKLLFVFKDLKYSDNTRVSNKTEVIAWRNLETKEAKLTGSFLLKCFKVLIDDCYCKQNPCP